MFSKKGRVLMILAFFLWAIFNIYRPAFNPGGPDAATIPANVWTIWDKQTFAPIIVTLRDQTICPETLFIPAEDTNRPGAFVKNLQAKSQISREKIEPFIQEEIKKGNMKNYTPFWIVNAFKVETNAIALQRLLALPQVQRITPDRRYSLPDFLLGSPAGQDVEIPYYASADKPGTESNNWNLELIKAPRVWQAGISGKDIVVAIMDTGVDLNHPALQGRYRGNFSGHSHATSWYDATADASTENSGPEDLNGHGTHIAGLILGGSPEEPLGVAPGACWIGVNIFSRGLTWDSQIIQAFQWLMAPGGNPQNAPRIINCSWASRPEYVTDYLQWEILQRLEQAGILVVFAAGNNKNAGPGSPASYPHALAVGAVQKKGDQIEIADFSSRGPAQWQGMDFLKPEITAPGVNIKSAWLKDSYITLDGTSLAAAHVSGTAALLLESNPELSPFEVGLVLKQTAFWNPAWDKEGERPNNTYGYGLLDAYAAIQKNTPPPSEDIFSDGAEEGIMNWSTSPENPWKISREKVYAGNLAFADSPWENYKNKTESWFGLAKPITLKGYHNPVLSFWHFYELQEGKNKENDYGYIEVSPDGHHWLSLCRFSGTNGQFQPFSLPLNLPQSAEFLYLRFRLKSNNNGPGRGWYLDNISITASPLFSGTFSPEKDNKPPEENANLLDGDQNNDGCIDLCDLALIARAYRSKPGDKNWNPRADLNYDGVVDQHDLNLFVEKLDRSGDSS